MVNLDVRLLQYFFWNIKLERAWLDFVFGFLLSYTINISSKYKLLLIHSIHLPSTLNQRSCTPPLYNISWCLSVVQVYCTFCHELIFYTTCRYMMDLYLFYFMCFVITCSRKQIISIMLLIYSCHNYIIYFYSNKLQFGYCFCTV